MDLSEKYKKLTEYLRGFGMAAVAFSGGVDSTFLLAAAKDALGGGAAAVTVNSRVFPARELADAKEFCGKNGIRQIICDFDALGVGGFSENPVNRCYLCKKAMFAEIKKAAAENGIDIIAEGSNLDDEGDYRPGLLAVKESGIKSPLREVGFTKREIREMSKRLGLSAWDKPSRACLASRFAYGDSITAEGLARVEKAEMYLSGVGFAQLRVRVHGSIARIEVEPRDFAALIDARGSVCDYLKSLGFSYVTMDLTGFRTGSMNEAVPPSDRG
ncbi:MAG: ATP-dependent sacrificial sulfur transferase LarE [Firmicutes bacterium]|nr:ATP-dependent sacrificial sulfur transferase LarE [Bacillota bacterium]